MTAEREDEGMTSRRPQVFEPVHDPSIDAEWAPLQRELRSRLRAAAPEFVARYTHPDGTLIWRESWAGMDGSDDPYEAFMYLALLYAIDGDEQVYELARKMWDAITWQWTQYGQIGREFDRYYDWMHHGESNLFLYFLGFTKPESVVDRQRAVRFARMYTGDDPLAPNFDRELGIIRAPHTGSDGPRFTITPEDYSTHRTVLADYPPPFEDLTTIPAGATTCDWTDDAVYAEVLERINERTARGDVPLNLNATGLLTHAYLYTGDAELRAWVLEYTKSWADRAAANDGVIPDNVGLSGEVGEYLDGRWWGGHYGWRWPHGLLTVFEPTLNASVNAYLLGGGAEALALIRGQLDRNDELGRDVDGVRVTPHKHFDSGWGDYRPRSAHYAIHLWSVTHDAADLARAESAHRAPEELHPRVPMVPFVHKHYNVNTAAWFEFARGRAADYPVRAMRANLDLLERQLARMRSDDGDPRRWATMQNLRDAPDGPSMQVDGYAIHAWQEFAPIYFESLVQLMWGAPMHIAHGGLQHGQVRFFDAVAQRPGLPSDIAALTHEITSTGCTVTLVNLGEESRLVAIQSGTFQEHRIVEVEYRGTGGTIIAAVDDAHIEVRVPAGATTSLVLRLDRHARRPSYETPYSVREDWSPLLKGRE